MPKKQSTQTVPTTALTDELLLALNLRRRINFDALTLTDKHWEKLEDELFDKFALIARRLSSLCDDTFGQVELQLDLARELNGVADNLEYVISRDNEWSDGHNSEAH